MAQSIAQIYKANREVLRDGILPYVYFPEKNNYAMAKVMQGAEKFQITKTPNSADFRIPLKMQPAGQYGGADYAGGPIGSGGSANIQQFTQTYLPQKMVYTLNYDTIKGSSSRELGMYNAWKESMKEAIPLFQRYADVSWHNIGGSQGIIGISSTLATATYTMNAANGADLFIEGQRVEVYDSTLVTWKTATLSAAGTLPTIAALDKTNKTITLSSVASFDSAAADGDKFLFPQSGGATPAWVNGLQYFNDAATSGNLLGLSRSTYPQIIANNVSASGGFSIQQVMLLKHRIKQRRGDVKKLLGLMPQAQEAVMNLSVVTQSEYQRTKVTESMIDPLPEMADMQMWAGIPHMTDLHQQRDRVDYVDRTKWGYVFLNDATPDFYKEPGSDKIFFTKYSSGDPAFAVTFALVSEQNYFNIDPGTGGYISAAPIGSGY